MTLVSLGCVDFPFASCCVPLEKEVLDVARDDFRCVLFSACLYHGMLYMCCVGVIFFISDVLTQDAQEQQLLHDLLAQLHIRMGSIQAKLEARKTELAAIPNADDDNTVEADNEPKAQDQSNEESQVCADTSSLDELSRSLDGSGARDRDGNEDNEDNVSETDTPSRQADKSMDAVNSLVADLVVSDPAPVPSGDLD